MSFSQLSNIKLSSVFCPIVDLSRVLINCNKKIIINENYLKNIMFFSYKSQLWVRNTVYFNVLYIELKCYGIGMSLTFLMTFNCINCPNISFSINNSFSNRDRRHSVRANPLCVTRWNENKRLLFIILGLWF